MFLQCFTKIEIAGYKSFADASIDLRAVNIFVGPNGAGKSNLASFFRVLRRLATGDLQSFVGASGGANMLLRYGAKRTLQIVSRFEVETISGPAVYRLQFEYAAGDKLRIAAESIERPTGDKEICANDGSIFESRFAENSRAGHGAALSVFRLFEGCRIYHFHDTSQAAPIRQHGDIEDNRTLHEDGANLAAFLYKIQETQRGVFELIVRTIRLAAPFFRTFSLAPRALNPKTIALRWREIDSDEDFGSHQLSDGTLRFIALVALLLQPEDDLPPVIFLDEPELGLHPYALELLASLIHRAARSCQVLVATQSPGLLNQFPPEEVVVVKRSQGASEFHRLKPAELAAWLEDYTLGELWDKNVLGGRPAR